jgi:hypothetical protein
MLQVNNKKGNRTDLFKKEDRKTPLLDDDGDI